jgi:hypothetical protein
MSDTFSIAQAYYNAGLCVIPVMDDGSKQPGVGRNPLSWSAWQDNRPGLESLRTWFNLYEGYGVICGAISGKLEVIDFDDITLYEPWTRIVQQEAPGLLDRLPIDESPRGGHHVYYRCQTIGKNLRLARVLASKDKIKTLIETRGEGGFIVVPPTSAAFHTTGKPYKMLQGCLEAIPEILPSERDVLLDAARSFNQYVAKVMEAPRTPSANIGNRPGDKWAAQITWQQILEPQGWVANHQRGETVYWTRPGKDFGNSATTGHNSHDSLHVFSSNALPFEPDTSYSKFAAYALLSHAGDFGEATKALVGMGFGSPAVATAVQDEPEWMRDAPRSEPPDDTEPLTQGATNTGFTPPMGTKPIAQTSSWADIQESLASIVWEWPRWLARGIVHILVGQTGKGKSSVALAIASRYLTGDPWPDSTPFTSQIGKILWLEGEAAQALNLQRMRLWSLTPAHIICPFPDPMQDVNLDNPQHQQAIAATAALDEIAVIVVDSLSGCMGARRDENSTEMLNVVKWLAKLARDLQKPVILLHHLRKRGQLDSDDRISIDRVRGSSAILQAARLVWALDSPTERDPEALRLSVIKSNLERFPAPIGLHLNENGVVFSTEVAGKPDARSQGDRIKEFLRTLVENGPVKATRCLEECEQAGFEKRWVEDVKRGMGIKSFKLHNVWHWGWEWESEELPL